MKINAAQRAVRVILVGVLIAGVGGLSGCAKWKERRAERRAARAAKAADRSMTLDGKFDDWPADAATVATSKFIYFRVTVQEQTQTSDALALWLDADNSASTGSVVPGAFEATGMGIDLIIDNVSTEYGRDNDVFAVGADGTRTRLAPSQVGLQYVKASGSQSWEVRISRKVDPDLAPTLSRLLKASGTARATFVLQDGTGRVVGWSDPETFTKPAFAP